MRSTFDELLYDIYRCKRCQFWRAAESEGVDYRPELPDLPSDRPPSSFKVLSFGINPGWAPRWEAAYPSLQEIYRIDDFVRYRQALRGWSSTGPSGAGPFDRGVAKMVNQFNSHLALFDGNVEPEDLWRTVFWANLSFCSSQTPYVRRMGGRDLPCNVMNEEIHNCLDAGFASDLYRFIQPRLVLLFVTSVTNVLHPSIIIRKVSGATADEAQSNVKIFSHPAVTRSNGGVTSVSIATARIGTTLFALLPHPNYRMTDENRALAISRICEL